MAREENKKDEFCIAHHCTSKPAKIQTVQLSKSKIKQVPAVLTHWIALLISWIFERIQVAGSLHRDAAGQARVLGLSAES